MVVDEIDGVVKLEVPVPPANGEPPVAAAYQSITAPAGGVALNVTVPVPHRDPAVTVGAVTHGRKTKNIALLRSLPERVTVPFPVEPAVDFMAQAAPIEPSSKLVVTSSSISVKLEGFVAPQFEYVRSLAVIANMMTAELAVVVVTAFAVAVPAFVRFNVKVKAPLIPECSKLYFLGCC